MAIGPTCKGCNKPMKLRQTCGEFSYNLQFLIDIVTSAGVKLVTDQQFACKSKVKNPKYKDWLALKKDYDKKMQERQKIIDKNNRMPIGLLKQKVPPPPPPPPPEPPQEIPCEHHWRKKATGRFNEKIIKKPKEFYYADRRKVEKPS